MIRLLSRSALLLPLGLLTGCGWLLGDEGMFPDLTQEYKRAPETAPMDIPNGT